MDTVKALLNRLEPLRDAAKASCQPLQVTRGGQIQRAHRGLLGAQRSSASLECGCHRAGQHRIFEHALGELADRILALLGHPLLQSLVFAHRHTCFLEIEHLGVPRYRARTQLFRFTQFELPWVLGPPDGRYLMRPRGAARDAAPTHVLVLATLGAPERRLLGGRRRARAEPEPEPTPVSTARATVIEVVERFESEPEAVRWLGAVGEAELQAGIAVLNRALHAFRLVTANPYVNSVDRRQAVVARVGYGAGEEVADGRWSDARELPAPSGHLRRRRVLEPQARLAAVLGAHDSELVCEELTLRARLDLDHGRLREATLQLSIALDAAIAELSADPRAPVLADRLVELGAARDQVSAAVQAAFSGDSLEGERAVIEATLARVEAALRARAAAHM